MSKISPWTRFVVTRTVCVLKSHVKSLAAMFTFSRTARQTRPTFVFMLKVMLLR